MLLQKSWMSKSTGCDRALGQLIANIRRPEAVANAYKLGFAILVAL